MSSLHRLTYLFVVILLAGVGSPSQAQNCQDQLRVDGAGLSRVTVSARELRIPEKAWQHFERACLAAGEDRVDAFEHEAAKALALAPDLTEIYVLRALLQIHAQQYEAAFATIATARSLRPVVPWSSVVVAGGLNNLQRYKEAAAELDRASSTESERWQWKFEKTRAELGLLNVESSLLWSERTLAEAPARCTDARVLRANALQLAGRFEQSITQMEQYLHSAEKVSHRTEVERLLERTRAVLLQEQADRLVAAK